MGQARIEARSRKLSMLLSSGLQASRASRFKARMNGDVPITFSTLSALPRWALRIGEDEYRTQLSRMAALLNYRPQMDREISGTKLQSIAEEFGENLIDAALSADLPPTQIATDVPLPRPDKMEEMGNSMINRALLNLNPSQHDNADTLALLAIAAAIVENILPARAVDDT